MNSLNLKHLLKLSAFYTVALCTPPLLLSATKLEKLDSQQTGISFQGSLARTAFSNTQFIDNSGVAAGDFDGDGRCDLFFCGGEGISRLYKNTGNWTFSEATEKAGLMIEDHYINAATFADVDGDQDLDLLLGSLYHSNLFYLNNGNGEFTRSDAIEWKTTKFGGTTSFALADVDLDGDLDLYTSNYRNTSITDQMTPADFDLTYKDEIEKIKAGKAPNQTFLDRFNIVVTEKNGVTSTNVDENGIKDTLYLNDGYGRLNPSTGSESRFRDSDGNSIEVPPDWGLTSIFRDVDGDGDPDLYVCNDFESPDRFWINDGQGYFSPASKLSLRRTSSSSMGVDFADIDRDGNQDFIVVDMLSRNHALRKKQMGMMVPTTDTIGIIDDRPQIMQNTLFLNQGDGHYSEIAQYSGLKASEWSWAPAFVDIDLDGYKDLVVTTGAVRDFMDADIQTEFKKHVEQHGAFTIEESLANQKKLPALPMQNFVFRNKGDMTFEDISQEWGISEEAISGGMALADFDNDGDLDIAINNTHSAPEIYRNNETKPRIAVLLRGAAPNTQAIGAQLELSSDAFTQTHEVTAGGIYASGSQTLRSFARPGTKGDIRLKITWPNGTQSQKSILPSDTTITLIESEETALEIQAAEKSTTPIFTDVSSKLQHIHHESPYDDFVHQPLLPNRLSQLGPGISWADLDNDGDDELLIPSGRGGKLTIFGNTPEGFARMDHLEAAADQTTILTSKNTNGNTAFLLGVSNHEIQNSETVFSAMPFGLNPTQGWLQIPPLPASKSTTGPMSQADVDNDGDLDLFIGGRATPGRYPEAADSLLYINEKGSYTLDTKTAEHLKGIGLVSGSVFGDIDQDGDPDLILACEWGPVRIFRNTNGHFTEATKAFALAEETGWWNGVTLGDFDNDGRLDIVATNWGRNSKYEGSYNDEHPLEIFYGDLNEDGTCDIVEAHFDKQMQTMVPERGFSCSSRAMPFVRERLKTFENFGLASLQEIYQEELEETDHVTANTLSHKLFLNRGDHFEATSLPAIAQLSTALGVSVGDMDGDGNEDLFLAQNFFAVQAETPRNDAGFGLLLKGDGKGGLTPLSATQSGIRIYGEQRGTALSDFDKDGRIDLAVAQNGAQTKLFKNATAKPGIRVNLQGTSENHDAIGSTLRLQFEGDSWGPSRLVSSGSGYYSQESATQVLATPSTPIAIRVIWPNGESDILELPPKTDSIELSISRNGEISWL